MIEGTQHLSILAGTPGARVLLAFDGNLLTNSPARFADVGPPAARLRYRVVEPADYHLKVIATNWVERGEVQLPVQFSCRDAPDQPLDGRHHVAQCSCCTVTGSPNFRWCHGHGVSPRKGWRCVLVDLRGHGKSTGEKIYFGLKESRDMSQLLDVLTNQGQVTPPVAVIGESYGAALALRWKTMDPRVGQVVAIAPYVVLSNAVLNICHDYASVLPRAVIRAGLKQLPVVLGVRVTIWIPPRFWRDIR